MIDNNFLKALCEIPSIGTSCGPVFSLIDSKLRNKYKKYFMQDGFSFYYRNDSSLDKIKMIYVTHVDEIGGLSTSLITGEMYNTLYWGNNPETFADHKLQAYDYLYKENKEFFPIKSELHITDAGSELILKGNKIIPFYTGWTFAEEAEFNEEYIYSKALDPRVAVYAILETVLSLDSPEIGMLFVVAEETSMYLVQKAVNFLRMGFSSLKYIINVDVPGIDNIENAVMERPVIRIFEARRFIDPFFGLQMTEKMKKKKIEVDLSISRTGSQTMLFSSLGNVISVAIPAEDVHTHRSKMSLQCIEKSIYLLKAIAEEVLG